MDLKFNANGLLGEFEWRVGVILINDLINERNFPIFNSRAKYADRIRTYIEAGIIKIRLGLPIDPQRNQYVLTQHIRGPSLFLYVLTRLLGYA